MFITSDFIFIHIPKTAGTFVNRVLSELYSNNIDYLIKRSLTKLKLSTSPTGHYYSKIEIPNLSGYPYGQHCGLKHLPERINKRNSFHISRDPLDYYKSLFKYGWYKKYPHLDKTTLDTRFKNYPQLTWDEIFTYYKLLNEKVFGKEKLKFGFLTYHIIDLISPSEQISKETFNYLENNDLNGALQFFKSKTQNISFFDISSLNIELTEYLKKNTNLPQKKIHEIIQMPKQNVSNIKAEHVNLNISSMPELVEMEKFAYKYWNYNY